MLIWRAEGRFFSEKFGVGTGKSAIGRSLANALLREAALSIGAATGNAVSTVLGTNRGAAFVAAALASELECRRDLRMAKPIITATNTIIDKSATVLRFIGRTK
jgi:hypothetical protein